MYELSNLHLLKEMYRFEETGYVFDSMCTGHTPSRAFVNDLNKPTILVVWDRKNAFYFGGEDADQTKYWAAVNFVKGQILDEGTRHRLGVAKVYYSSEAWEDILLEGFQEFQHRVAERVLFKHNLEQIPVFPADENVLIKEINAQIINDLSLANVQLMAEEICGMWGALDTFLREGFGYCAIQDNQIICWCTGEYFSDDLCGIGIETLEQYQKQGVATRTAASFLKKCRATQRTPYWDSWKANTPSVRVAEKVGFSRVKEYKILFVALAHD